MTVINYHTTSAILGIALALTILALIRRDHLRIRYSVWWLIVAASTLVLGVFPGLIDIVGNSLGVAYPPTLVIVIGIGAVLIKMLIMDIEHSRQERQIRRLVQRLAMHESDGKAGPSQTKTQDLH